MTTKQDVLKWAELLNGAISNVAQRVKQDKFNVMFQQGMQPQQNTQWNAPPPMRGINPGVQGALNAPLPQTTTTQPSMLQVLNQIVSQNPEMAQQAQPLIENQYNTAMAAKAPWMEQGRGGLATNMVTGEQISNPMESMAQQIKPSVNQKVGLNQKTGKWEWFDVVERDGETKWKETGVEAKESVGAGERPYFSTVVDRDGNVKVFDTRTGKFIESSNTVIKAAPTEVRMFVSALDNNLSSIKGIRDINNRGDLTGVISGRARKFGTRFFSDEEAQKLRSRVGQLRTIIYGLSGKQINESEQKWLYDEILPNMSNPTENFEAALDEFEKWVKTKKGELIKQFPNIKDIQEKETTPTGTGKFKILKVE